MLSEAAIKLWLSTFTLVVAVIGGIYTAFQYQRNKRNRAIDLAIALTGQLETVQELAFACQALDWGGGPLIVPDRYRCLLERSGEDGQPPTPRQRGEVVDHDVGLMAAGLEVSFYLGAGDQPVLLIYRYCFDKLFNHLSNVERLVASGQLAIEDLGALRYWLKRIACYEYPPPNMAGTAVFQPFLKDPNYDYSAVIALGRRLGIHEWDHVAAQPA